MMVETKSLFYNASGEGEHTPEDLEIAHYIKQEVLAQMIAASREVVSSSLNQLRTLGLINYSRKGRLTVNVRGLQAYLENPISGK